MKKASCFILIVLLFGTACNPVYVPSRSGTHFLKAKDEGDVSGAYGSDGFNGQAAYSPLPHAAVEISASGIARNKGDTTTDSYNGHVLEGGVGGYYFWKKGYLAEMYAGYGKGYTRSYSKGLFYHESVEGTYTRFYIRPALGFHIKSADMMIGFRFSSVEMDFTDYGLPLTGHYSTLFYEPYFCFRTGGPRLRFFFNTGFAWSGELPEYDYEPLHVSFGIAFHFGENIQTAESK